MQTNRPVGPAVPNWTPRALPDGAVMEGRYARLEKLSADAHAEAMWPAFEGHEWVWDYMPVGPFAAVEEFRGWMAGATTSEDILFHAIFDKERGEYGGFASYLRMKPAAGSIEVGFIAMAPQLQQTRASTEAMYLMMKWAFEAGYRRYEWKCDALNYPSRRAAQRLGFSYEGVFRQALVTKGRNRDTAWLAMIDADWPALDAAFQAWLDPANFDVSGSQIKRLGNLTAPARVADDPALG